MSTDSKLEALRTGLEMAQELLAIKREALGDDYRLTRTYWEAERELQAALADAEQEQAGEAVAWLVIDSTGQPMHAAWCEAAAHEHINDAINEYDLHEASEWRVVPVYSRPLEPLTQTKLIALWADKSDGPSNAEIVSFARAIERALGITKDTK